MLYSFSGQLSMFLWDLAVLLDLLVLICMFFIVVWANKWLIDWLITETDSFYVHDTQILFAFFLTFCRCLFYVCIYCIDIVCFLLLLCFVIACRCIRVNCFMSLTWPYGYKISIKFTYLLSSCAAWGQLLHFAWVVDNEKCIGSHAPVCLSVPRRIPTLPYRPGCNFGNGRGCPLVVHYWCTGFVPMTT